MNKKKILWFIKCLFGFGTVEDGSICWFSKRFYDIHDYHKIKGGDGTPYHFFNNTCRKCKADFKI